MKARFCFLAIIANLVFSSLFAQSKNIIFITDDPGIEYEQVEFLQNYGFSVMSFWPGDLSTADPSVIDMLNAADLVIIGYKPGSGNFMDPNKQAWNNLTAPLIANKPWSVRSSRLNWVNSTSIYRTVTEPVIAYARVSDMNDPIFTESDFENDSIPWSSSPNDYLVSSEATNGEIVATYLNDMPMVVRFEESVEFYPGAIDFPAGPRTYFGFGNDVEGYNYFPLTESARQAYLKEIIRLTFPNTCGVTAPVVADTTITFGVDPVPDLIATATSTVKWYGDAGMSTPLYEGTTYSPGVSDPGVYNYWVTQTDGCESLPDIVVLTIVCATPAPEVEDTTIVFYGEPVPDLTAVGINISWYSDESLETLVHAGNTFATGETEPGIYTYYVTQTDGCEGPAVPVTLKIRRTSAIYISTTGSDATGDGTELNPFATIQHGLDIAIDGDTVLMLPGTYVENVSFSDKDLLIGSLFLKTEDPSYTSLTIMDGNSTGTVLASEFSDFMLTGLTLQNGQAGDYGGGGLIINECSADIINCVFINNSGIGTDEWGAGAITGSNCNTRIINCLITENNSPGGAGGVRIGSGTFSIVNTVISDNTGNFAIHLNSATGTIINSTIYGNPDGGLLFNNSPTDVRNCIFWNNGPDDWGAFYDIQYTNSESGVEGTGNISLDPDFIDAASGDFGLNDGSPCVNTGTYDITGLNLPATDIEGNPRIFGDRIDMGAYENQNVSIPGIDLAVTGWEEPQQVGQGSTNETISVTIMNYGSTVIPGFDLSYSIDNGASYITEAVAEVLDPFESYTYAFSATADMSVAKTYQCVAAAYVAGDENTGNDTMQIRVKPEFLPVFYTTESIVIDGIADESCWQNPDSIPMEMIILGGVDDGDDLKAHYRIRWDENNLYLFFNIEDNILFNSGENDWMNDNVELYFDMNNSRSDSYDHDDRQIRFVWENPDLTGINVPGGITFVHQTNVGMDGYKLEIAIPWESLGIPASGIGVDFGFEVYITDLDEDPEYQTIFSWYSEQVDNWWNPGVNGTALLMDENGELPVSATAMIKHGGYYHPHDYTFDFGQDFTSPVPFTWDFEIKNVGQNELNSMVLNISGSNYSVSSLATTTLQPGETTGFTVSLDGSSPGVYNGTIELQSNDPASPYMLYISKETIINDKKSILYITPDEREYEQIEYLRTHGFFVNPFWPGDLENADQGTIDLLNAADLVILGRSSPSLTFADPHKQAWNALTSPVLSVNQWASRNTRINWFNSSIAYHENEGPDTAYATVLDVDDPIFAESVFEGNSIAWCLPPHDFIEVTEASNAQILATYNGNSPLIARFETGVEFYPGSGDFPAGPRSYFGFGNDATGWANFFPLTASAKDAYLKEIIRMIYPDCEVRAPIVRDTTVNYGDPLPELSAVATESVRWYEDGILTTLLHEGNTYTPVVTDIGTYNFFVTQTGICESVPDIVVLNIICGVPPPEVKDTTVFTGQPVPDLEAIGTNISWYDDPSLQNLVYTGNTFSTGATDPGYYTYYVTQTGICESDPVSVTLTIRRSSAIYISETGSDETGDGTELNPFATIQHGIDIAMDGDSIVALPGTYYEVPVIEGKAVILGSLYCKSQDPSYISQTTISGNGIDPVLTVRYVSGTEVVGLTFRAGSKGLFCEYSSPFIRNNIVKNNIYDGLDIQNCTGILVYNNLIINNDDEGIDFSNSSGEVINNTLHNNGLNPSPPGYPTSAVECGEGTTSVIMNNIMMNNGDYGVYAFDGSSPVVSFNDVIGYTVGAYEGTGSSEGEIENNPMFVNSIAEDYHLLQGSPCINAGNPVVSFNDVNGSPNDMGHLGGPYGESYTYQDLPVYPEAGLVAYYTFDMHVLDQSGNSNHGIDRNMGFGADRFGTESSAAAFNGHNSYVEVPNNNDFSLTDAFTVTTWVRSDGNTWPQRIICNWHITGEGNQHYIFDLNFESTLRTSINSQYRLIHEYNSTYLWHLVSFVYENPVLKVYVDDQFVHLDTALITAFNPTNTVPVIIGSGGTNMEMPQYVFNGEMDDMKIYNRALSDAEIATMYNDYASVGSRSVEVYPSIDFEIPVGTSRLESADNIVSYEFDLVYDPAVATYQDVNSAGTLSENGSATGILNSPGNITVSYSGVDPLEGEGDLVKIIFNAVRELSMSVFTIENFRFNNGSEDIFPPNPKPDHNLEIVMPRTQGYPSRITMEDIAIDGHSDELLWDQANFSYMYDYAFDCYGTGADPADLFTRFKSVWKPGTDGGIYIYAEITDDVIDTWESGDDESLKDNVEIYFHIPYNWDEPLRSDIGYYQDGTVQIRHNAMVADHVTGKSGYSGGIIPEFDLVQYAFAQNDTGYTYEAFFPFEALLAYVLDDGISVENFNETSRNIGFDIQVTDSDEPSDPLLCKMMWNDDRNGNQAWDDTRYFGEMNLANNLIYVEPLTGEYMTDENTVLLLHLNETEGVTAYDVSGYGNNGYVESTIVVDGKMGLAREFSGYPDRITVSENPTLSFGTGSYTIESWMKVPPGSGGHTMHKRGSDGRGWFTFIDWDGRIGLSVYNDPELEGDEGNNGLMSNAVIADDTWHHVAFVITSETMQCYVDGLLDAEADIGWPGSSDNDGTIEIGVESHTGQFIGVLDEIRISNIARSPEEFNVFKGPSNLSAALDGSQILLTWDPVTEVELHKYNIYKGTAPDAVALYDSVLGAPPDTFYMDSYSNPGYLYYHVTAVDLEYNESVSTQVMVHIPDTVDIPFTSEPITIDGVGDESIWQSITPVPVEHLLGGTIDDPDDLSATYKVCWDLDSLYFLFDITDDSLYNLNGDTWWDNDKISIYLDMDNSRYDYYFINDWNIGIKWEEDIYPNRYLEGYHYVHHTNDLRDGYQLEVAFSLQELGFPLHDRIGIDIDVMDRDGEDSGTTLIFWNTQINDNWERPSSNGVGHLLDYAANIPAEAIAVVSAGIPQCGLEGAMPSVELYNFGSTVINEFDIQYAVNGVPISPETVTLTINPGDTALYIFTTPLSVSETGYIQFDVTTLLDGGDPHANIPLSLQSFIFGDPESFENWKTYSICNGRSGGFNTWKMMTDSQGDIWMAAGIVERLNPVTEDWTVYNSGNSNMSNDESTYVFEDHSGNIWVALDQDEGIVTMFDGVTWTSNNPDNIHVLSIFEDSQNNMWFGTWDHGVRKWDPNLDEWTTYNVENSGLASNIIFKDGIMEDSEGNMWFGTAGNWGDPGGLCKFDGISWTTYDIGNSGLPSNQIICSIMDSEGNIWMGFAWNRIGLCRFDGTDWEIFNTGNSGITSDYVYVIFEDAEGNIWCGTEAGACKFDGSEWTVFNNENSGLFANLVETITQDAQGNMWFAGSHGGLYKYTQSTAPLRHFTPVWTGNGDDHMNFYALTATIDGIDMQPGDEIGIFDGDYCVGMGTLTEVLDVAHYLSMVASRDDDVTPEIDGYTPGNEVTYKLWDSSEAVEIDARLIEVTYEYGTGIYEVGASVTFHLAGVTEIEQIVPLITGWNIFSLAVTPQDTAMMSIIQPLIDEGSLIKVQNEAGNAIEDVFPIGWVDNIDYWRFTEGYKIKVNTNTDLTVSGVPVALPADIGFITGWNIMGYPALASQEAEAAVADLISSGYLIKVQDEAGNAIEDVFPIGWVDNIEYFDPGEGYKVKVNTDCILTINEPAGGMKSTVGKVSEVEKPSHFRTSWSGNGLDHMNVYINVTGENGFSLQPGDEIGIYDGSLCVGSGIIRNIGNGYYPLIASADDPTTGVIDGFRDGNTMTFKLWRPGNDIEIDLGNVEYLQGYSGQFEQMGTTSARIHVSASDGLFGTTVLGDNYPNPFATETIIPFYLGEQTMVDLAMYNMLGQRVSILLHATLDQGSYKVTWTGTNRDNEMLLPGIYFCKMVAGDKVYVKAIELIGDKY